MMRRFGTTGVEVSVVGIGGWQMGGPDTPDGIGYGWGDVDDERSVRIIHRAEELGVNLIDTADVYGNGHSEAVIGRALAGRRDRWVIASKGGRVKTPEKRGEYKDYSATHIREACEASLQRLGTDYLDFYQLHGDPAEDLVADTMTELAILQDEGKIRFYGISTSKAETIQRLLSYGPLQVCQIGYNLLKREQAALDYCAEQGIGTLIRTPLAHGAAFGRYATERPPKFEFGDLRSTRDPEALAEEHAGGLSFFFCGKIQAGRRHRRHCASCWTNPASRPSYPGRKRWSIWRTVSAPLMSPR
jgi:myo-inositol catabolism protein IolS